MCYLRLYVKGRGRGVLSKSAIFNNVVFFDVVFERTPPTAFVRSASKFFSKLTRCNLRKVVLFATLRQRAWPWRAVKVGHFEFSRIFFQCLGTNFSQGICPFGFNICQYSQNMVLNKCCALLRLYVEGRGHGVPSKLAILNRMSNCDAICAIPPPRSVGRDLAESVGACRG